MGEKLEIASRLCLCSQASGQTEPRCFWQGDISSSLGLKRFLTLLTALDLNTVIGMNVFQGGRAGVSLGSPEQCGRAEVSSRRAMRQNE